MSKNVSHYLEVLQQYADDYFQQTGKDRADYPWTWRFGPFKANVGHRRLT